MNKNKLLNSTQLVEMLGYTRKSLYTIRWRIKNGQADSNSLPTPLKKRGQLRWTLQSVLDWLDTLSQPEDETA